MVSQGYRDRREAGRVLADALQSYREAEGLLVLGLPRGGVPVAYEVAEALHAPLDLMIVRKLGLPGQPELAMGAIASGGGQYLHQEVVSRAGIDDAELNRVIEKERAELQRREREYRGDRPWPNLQGRLVMLVDDGLATGSSMMAAARATADQDPSRVVVAVPVAPPSSVDALKEAADDVVCPLTPQGFMAVGQWYQQFEQTTDEEVRDLLQRAWREAPGASRQ